MGTERKERWNLALPESTLPELLDELGKSLEALKVEFHAKKSPKDFDDRVWTVYLEAEQLVASFKLQHEIERPGKFIVLPKVLEDGDGFIAIAIKHLTDTKDKASRGQNVEAFESLRGVRNYLRAYLSERRTLRLKEARRANKSRT